MTLSRSLSVGLMRLSRIDAIQSPIIPIVGELIKNSPGTISLGQGIVYYSPPSSAIDKLKDFFDDPSNNIYKDVIGIPSLLETIHTKLTTFNNIQIDENTSVVVTAGSNMAFMNSILAITQPGDEIILNTPYYFNHEMAIRMAGCVPVLAATDDSYQININNINQAITEKTRAVVTISPNNPTGVIYSQQSLYQVNQLCKEKQIYHISDEAYEYFTYENTKHISPGSFQGAWQHTISLYSLSKSYGFASWRIGYMVIPKYLLTSIKKIQDTILICPTVISQYAAIGALETDDSYLRDHVADIAEVRKIVLEALKPLQTQKLCDIITSYGAFYVFMKVNTNMNDIDLVKRLINEFKVAVIPGTTFGIEEDQGCYLRVAYGALQKDTVREGISRFVLGIQTILSQQN